jgi:hypothetical protein
MSTSSSANISQLGNSSSVGSSLRGELSVGFVGDVRPSPSTSYGGASSSLGGVSYSGGSLISSPSKGNLLFRVKTSDNTMQSWGSGGGSMFSTSGGSFINMHRHTEQNLKLEFTPQFYIDFPTGNDTPPTGQLDPDYASPVGDMVLPMLLFAAVYAVVRFCKRRKLQTNHKPESV